MVNKIDYFFFVDEVKRAWMVPVEELTDKIIVTLDKKVMSNRNWTTDEAFDSERYRVS